MSFLIFALLSLISIILGIYSFVSLPNSIFLFLLYSSIVPNGIQFKEFISFSGLFFLDLYFILLLIHYIVLLLKFKINKQFFLILFSMIFLFSYLFPKLVDLSTIDKYLLKDLRPFLTLTWCAILFFICYEKKIIFSDKKLFLLLNSIFISKIIFFFLILIFPITYEDESYRYLDCGGYIAISFLLIYLTIKDKSLIFKNKIYSSITLFLSISTILVSTSRTIMLSLLVVLFLLSKANILFKAFIASTSVFSIYALAFIFEIDRIKSTFEPSRLSFYIFSRFYPAIEHIRNMDYYQLIFGKGIGTTFNIPWFDYRENLDPILNNIDSTYFTFYVKYGIFSIFIMFVYISSTVRLLPIKTKLAFIFTILVMYITMALPYQIFTLYFIIFTNIISIRLLLNNK